MLDKQTTKLLIYLAEACGDGSFKVIETPELAKQVSRKADIETIRPIMKFLTDNEMIDIKYSDDSKYSLAILPKGRVYVETLYEKKQEIKITRRMARYIIIGAAIAAFAGAALAGAVIELIGRIF